MPKVDYGDLAHMQERWKNNPTIPVWKRDHMNALMSKFKSKVADNHGDSDGVELYYPEDCNDYDAFMTVACALDALVIPRSDGCVMRMFGDYSEDKDVS